MKTQFELHGLTQVMHVNPCRAVKLREKSMLVHVQIISTESDKITESKFKFFMSGGLCKEKTHFFAVSICLRFERPVEVAQKKATHSLWVVVVQKSHSFRQETL